MIKTNLIASTKNFVKQTLQNAEAGHDWLHVERVYYNAVLINKQENADETIVALGALLHDIADAKFYNGNENIGPQKARIFLETQQVDELTIVHIEQIIKHVSYRHTLNKTSKNFESKELQIIQDADRLDAIGAIGIARTFNYGGYKNRKLYDPNIAPNLNMTKETYQTSDAPTINHFYEKLLRLKDLMNTDTGKRIAEERHQFMLAFLEQFYNETGIAPPKTD